MLSAEDFAQHARAAQEAIASNNTAVARQELLAMLRLDPGNADAHANLGMVEFLEGAYEDAAKNFQAVLFKSPSLVNARAFLGMCELRLGKASQGRELLEASLPGVSDRTLRIQAGLELVRSYSEAGMFEKAEPVLKSLEAFDPSNAEVLYTLYRLHSELASAALRKLTTAGPDSAFIHEVLGQNFMAQDQYSAAIREFRKAIDLGPRLQGLRYQLGEALFAAERTEENRALAEKEFREELKMNPSDAGSLYKLGEIAIERSNIAQAREYIQRALSIRPEFAEAHATMGKILEQSGDSKGAIAELEIAAKIAPEIKTTHYKLAQLYRGQGRNADADREFAIFRSLSSKEMPASGVK